MTNINVIEELEKDASISEKDKKKLADYILKMRNEKVNILITGATGSGKSSTINALFESEKAKVGVGSRPETMDIKCYEFKNLNLWDSPGLGDGKEEDIKHSKGIIEKLTEKDKNGELLIDIVLVILDGSSRDLGTSFQLINNVIIPNLGEDKSRLIVAINQADVAMKGRNWDCEKNEPNQILIDFLNEKVESTKERIRSATGVNVNPIYYSAGYKEEGQEQQPYNLSKLLLSILKGIKQEKRVILASDMNKDAKVWEKDDQLEDYQQEINQTFIESVVSGAKVGSEIGEKIGSVLGSTGKVIGGVIGGAVGAVWGALTSWW